MSFQRSRAAALAGRGVVAQETLLDGHFGAYARNQPRMHCEKGVLSKGKGRHVPGIVQEIETEYCGKHFGSDKGMRKIESQETGRQVVASHRVPADHLLMVLEGRIAMVLPRGRFDLQVWIASRIPCAGPAAAICHNESFPTPLPHFLLHHIHWTVGHYHGYIRLM